MAKAVKELHSGVSKLGKVEHKSADMFNHCEGISQEGKQAIPYPAAFSAARVELCGRKEGQGFYNDQDEVVAVQAVVLREEGGGMP